MFEIGTSLREARLRRQIDIVEAEQDTKIRSKYLAALESEDFDVLPGAVYTRGFLRTYASYLGLDSQLFIDEYNSRFGRFEDEHEQVANRRLRLNERRRAPRFRTVAIVCLILGAIAAWYGVRSQSQETARSEKVLRESAASTPERTSPDLGVQAAAARSQAEAEKAVPAGTSDSPRQPSPTQVAKLTIATPRGSSWMQVRRGSVNGQVMFDGTLNAGQKRNFTAPRIYVTIGYPSAVLLQLPKTRLAPDTSSTTSYLVTPTTITPA